jgi:Ca2+-binding EF-hand superfamily protein
MPPSTHSGNAIYKAALASFINPVYEARQEAEAAVVRETVGLDEQGRPLSPIKRLEKYFSILDANSDYKISAKDLAEAWVASVTNPTANDLELIAREIDRFMKIADIDHDGSVSLNEYLHYMLTLIREKEDGRRGEIHGLIAEKATKDPQVVDKLIEWFLEKDKEGNGEISVSDFQSILDSKVKLRETKKNEINDALRYL